jgi:hypothetical protein
MIMLADIILIILCRNIMVSYGKKDDI